MPTRRAVLAAAGATLAAPAIAQGARTPVRVGFVPVIGAAPLFVMTGAGWTAAAGLDLSLRKFESGPPAVQALASGTLDVLFVGVAPVAVARSRGLPVRIVAVAGIGGSGFAVQAPLAAAFDAAGGRAREAFARFRAGAGRPARIGALPPGSTPTVALRYWLKAEGVDAADLAIQAMGIEAIQGAMLAGAVDGGAVLEPALTLVRRRNPGVRTVATAPAMFPNLPGVVVSVTDAFAAAHPAAVEALVRLAIRADRLIADDPGAVAGHVGAALGGGLVETDVYAEALRSPAVAFAVDPRIIAPATAVGLAFQAEIGDFATAPSVEGLFDASFFLRASSAG